MGYALLLVDLQEDFLNHSSLEPNKEEIVERSNYLLQECRRLSIPVIHILTTVQLKPDNRMPHWQIKDRRLCVKNTVGHSSPPELSPIISKELIVNKTFFSGFQSADLEFYLQKQKIDTLIIAGIYLHGCIRSTVLDAYQKGYQILIAEDATGSYDPLHSAITYNYLEGRAAQFASVSQIISQLKGLQSSPSLPSPKQLPVGINKNGLIWGDNFTTLTHYSPRDIQKLLWKIPIATKSVISKVCSLGSTVIQDWQNTSIAQRVNILDNLAFLLVEEKESLATQLATELGKPITSAEGEVDRAIALLREVIKYQDEPLEYQVTEKVKYRYQPLGLIALITPWNNPLAIPIGKIAPALLYGNNLVWKPAPAGSAIALKLLELLQKAGCPDGVVNVVLGDRHTATILMKDPNMNAVSLSGSSNAGYTAQAICASRRIPLQAELGGNNGAIVWSDCDLETTAKEIILGAFSFAGQRCTANRRVIVQNYCYNQFLNYLRSELEKLNWGDPLDSKTNIGPLVSSNHYQRVANIVERAKKSNLDMYSLPLLESLKKGNYYPPTIICCDNYHHEIVEEETFGPVLVVQKAHSWSEAISLCNGVKQGLVAALFSESPLLQKSFLNQIQAGVLKLNKSTADVDVDVPFGGWKTSGTPIPEVFSSLELTL